MLTSDYNCKECGRVFEGFRHFSDYDKEIKCCPCGSDKAERIFSVPQISGERVAGSGCGKTDFPPISREPSRGMGRGMR